MIGSRISHFLMMPLFEYLVCLGLIFGPVFGFIPQYRQILSTRNAAGFSTLVCFILITANILRCFFWVLQRFEVSLLLQSVVMVFAQLILLELIVRIELYNRRTKDPSLNYVVTRGFPLDRFWKWDYFGEYVAFVSAFIMAVGSIALINLWILHSTLLTQSIGFMALMIEATIGFPILYQNYSTRTSGSLRMELIVAWLAGDAFKTIFFLIRSSPPQFIICGLIQLTVDCTILYQMIMYPPLPLSSSAGIHHSLHHLQPSRGGKIRHVHDSLL